MTTTTTVKNLQAAPKATAAAIGAALADDLLAGPLQAVINAPSAAPVDVFYRIDGEDVGLTVSILTHSQVSVKVAVPCGTAQEPMKWGTRWAGETLAVMVSQGASRDEVAKRMRLMVMRLRRYQAQQAQRELRRAERDAEYAREAVVA